MSDLVQLINLEPQQNMTEIELLKPPTFRVPNSIQRQSEKEIHKVVAVHELIM